MSARAAGAAVRILGQLGDDAPGQRVLEQLNECDIEVLGPRLGRTGTTIILVDTEREASRLADRGSSIKLGAVPEDGLEHCRMVHVPLSALTSEPLATVTYEVIGRAIDAEIELAIDLVSVSTVEAFGRAEAASLIGTARPAFVIGSVAELSGLRPGARDPVPGAGHTVITNGARPTLVVDAKRHAISTPVDPIDRLVDRSGRGGAFVGGFLAAHLGGHAIGRSVLEGHTRAAAVLASPGGMPRRT